MCAIRNWFGRCQSAERYHMDIDLTSKLNRYDIIIMSIADIRQISLRR